MKTTFSNFFIIAGTILATSFLPTSEAEVHSLVVKQSGEPISGYFNMGSNKSPFGDIISINSKNILYNSAPWIPITGEFHVSRYPQKEWKEELKKIKQGGIDVVASYVFWNHHEEIEGSWNWNERRDLRKFLETCKEVGLMAIVRVGPWCNGEVRYGGFPDWIQHSLKWESPKDKSKRPDSSEYLASVKRLYQQIGQQMKGLYWKDGGPIIGIQIENEYSGTPEHLLALKKLAREAGMDVPLYTKTGWPKMEKQMPLGELIPLYGAYPDAAWESSYEKFEGLKDNYSFRSQRTDEYIASDFNNTRGEEDEASRALYPFLTAETGGGMFVSDHRRVLVDPKDVASLALCQLGSGCVGIGYYMYHGGENPSEDLNKTQKIGDIFDTNVISYDFQAPLGEYGQIREHYKWLRRMHLFIDGFKNLAEMPASIPSQSLRWSVRSKEDSGFIFVNNYQRLLEMPAVPGTSFEISLPSGPLMIPSSPITIPQNSFFFWPFNLDVNGIRMVYATAQPVSIDGSRLIFAKIPDISAEFVFDSSTLLEGSQSVYENVQTGIGTAFSVTGKNNNAIQVVLLSHEDSMNLTSNKLTFDKEIKTTTIPLAFEQIKPFGSLRDWKSIAEYTTVPSAPSDKDFEQAAVFKIVLPKNFKKLSNPMLKINYQGDVARLYGGNKLLTDNFYNGTPFEVGLKRHFKSISKELTLKILPLQQNMPIYFEEGKRPSFDSNGISLKLESVQLTFEKN